MIHRIRTLLVIVVILISRSASADCAASVNASLTNHDTDVTFQMRGAGSCDPRYSQSVALNFKWDDNHWDWLTTCPSTNDCTVTWTQGIGCHPEGTHTMLLAVDCMKPAPTGEGCAADSQGVAQTQYTITRIAQPSGAIVGNMYYNRYNIPVYDVKAQTAYNAALYWGVGVVYTYLPTKRLPEKFITDRALEDEAGNQAFSIPHYDGYELVRMMGHVCSTTGISVFAVPDADRECCDCKGQPATCVGSPIRVSNGNMRYDDRDPLPVLPRGLARAYDSSYAETGLFGYGWSSVLDSWLRTLVEGNGTTTIVIGTPENHRYVFNGTGAVYQQLWPQGANPATLTFTGGAYVFREYGSDLQLWYAPSGLLAKTHSMSSGREFSFTYANSLPTSITDSWANGSLAITTNPTTGLITNISSYTGPSWTYGYDSGKRLTSVTVDGATWRTYNYSGNYLTEAHDGAGHLIESHGYAATGEATTSVGGRDEVQAIDFYGSGRVPGETVTTVTSTAGAVTRYYTRYIAGRPRTVQVEGACFSCGTRDAVYAYDANGRLVMEQDARGYLTTRTFDANGRETGSSGPWRPASCDPATDTDRCRLTPDTMSGTLLVSLPETITKTMAYGDTNWPDRPTQATVTTVTGSGHVKTETWTYDPTTGQVLEDAVTGWGLSPTAPEEHVTTTALYTGTEGAPFAPGGAFLTAWQSEAQPAGFRKSIDGPRTDVVDTTTVVYYPFAAGVPDAWRGHVAAIMNAAGHVTRFENYDLFGNATRVVDANEVATEMTYNAVGRILTTTLKAASGCDTSVDPLCATDLTSTRTYTPAAGPLATEQRPNGNVVTYEYDARGRVTAVSRGPLVNDLRERMETSYDPASGNKSQERMYAREAGTWVEKRRESFAYDSFGRLQTTTHADNTTIAYSYDPSSNLASVKDENHATANTSYAYDPANRLTGVTQTLSTAPGGQIATHYTYDVQGNLTAVTDPNGNVTTYVYDDFGRMLTQVSPVTGTTTYAYDLAGDLISATDANGATTTRTYDVLGRVTQALSERSGLDSETVSYTYDEDVCGTGNALGRLSTMDDGGTAYCYDRRGLLTSTTTDTVLAFTYDANGNRNSILYPSGKTAAYTFDFADRPSAATFNGTSIVTSASYLPFGPRTQMVFGNATTQAFTYDNRYRPSENKLAGPSGNIADYVYAEDAAGNITQIHDAIAPAYNRDFGYDDLNRLTVANSGTGLWGTGSYQYDAMGNMTELQLGSRTEAFTSVGSTPKIQSVSGALVDYDAAGNETSAVYSARNLLARVGAVNTITPRTEYAYDGRGVRVLTTSIHPGAPPWAGTTLRQSSIYSPELHLLAKSTWRHFFVEGTFNGTEYLWFGDLPVGQAATDSSTSLRYTFADHLGAPILQTDATRDIVWRAEYEPYGAIYAFRSGDATDTQVLRFPGQEASTDASGMEYNIFRWYRAEWGRYTQADPILSAAFNESLTIVMNGETPMPDYGSYAWYTYASDRPTTHIDGLGLKDYMHCTLIGDVIKESRYGGEVLEHGEPHSKFVITRRWCYFRCYCDGRDNCYRIPCLNPFCKKDHGVSEKLNLFDKEGVRPCWAHVGAARKRGKC